MGVPPVHFFSHGSTRMIEADTTSAAYWEKCGKEALAHDVRGIVIMGAHWECLGDRIEVATNPNPDKGPCPFVNPDMWINWKPNPHVATANRCVQALAAEGFDVVANSTIEWHHDIFMPLIRMFPDDSKCPPTLVLSTNARYDPFYHVKNVDFPHTVRQILSSRWRHAQGTSHVVPPHLHGRSLMPNQTGSTASLPLFRKRLELHWILNQCPASKNDGQIISSVPSQLRIIVTIRHHIHWQKIL